MTPTHHMPEELLVEYVAGNTAEAVSLAVACHLTLCGACQQRARQIEDIAGSMMATSDATALHPDALTQTLARLDAPAGADLGSDPVATVSALGLPRPLLGYLGPAADIPWKRLVPGVRGVDLVRSPGPTAFLARFAPGVEIPHHDHEGPEYTVIFTGGLEDGPERFHRGDVAVADSGKRHVQRAETAEPCVALVVNCGELVPLTWKGRLLKLWSRV